MIIVNHKKEKKFIINPSTSKKNPGNIKSAKKLDKGKINKLNRVKAYKEMFKLLDTDNKGIITLTNIKSLSKNQHIGKLPENILVLYSDILSKAGKMNLNEFIITSDKLYYSLPPEKRKLITNFGAENNEVTPYSK